MNLFMTILLVFCAGFFVLSEGRGGGGRSSSSGGWRSSGSSWGSSSSSSSSSGSSWGSSSSSSGNSWGSSSSSSGSPWGSSSVSSGSSGSRPGSPIGRRDNPSGVSPSIGNSPPSSMIRSNKPGKQTSSSNPDDDPIFSSRGSQSSGLSNARLWRRNSWIRYNRPYSSGRSSSDDDFEGSSSGTNATYVAENPAPTIYDMIPDCEALGAAMWAKYDELTQSGEMSFNSCEDVDNPDVCIRQDIEKVRCAVTESIPKECMDKILTFVRGGGDICKKIAVVKIFHI
ncbi:uncharacterized protein DDB_G0271670-like [Argiope bruennichi]|uniref:uncharacterized protein DDB_G0271670-like n=1 Tax=Argiope bruennichi TaxID=94029 RepID=UPI0024955646|nr:uncharacterized protein DDB_G0271670-like [Argiope bruennichi]